ncbi:hypothetical protein [Amycolatopsis sp. GM8]|uniref:hypothetical protein n=1 Tax=Amycolatopsis sp. GM8 TaxID=2896530 RepID=UPI001F42C9DB|nr:hypothetical protein [Amycolatopsis sp. GM8]
MDERDIENHPDLMDPDWQRHAVKEAWTEHRRNQRRGRTTRRLGIWVVVLVVVVAAGIAIYRWGKATSDHYAGGGEPLTTATTTPPSDLPDFARVDLTRPFDNTPAQNWAENITGLVMPPATKVGTFSAEQVKSAQDQVKQAIVESSLDLDVLQQHKFEKYVGLLAPDARADARANPTHYLTPIADGNHLLPVPPRLNGTASVRPGDEGELIVHVTYLVAYAFDPGSHQVYGPGDMEPYVRTDADYILRSGPHWKKSSYGLWLGPSNLYFTESACKASDQGQIAPVFSEPNFNPTSLTPEPGRFDPNQPMPTGDNCH